MKKINDLKEIKRSDLWVHMDSQLYTMLCNGIHISHFENWEAEKKQRDDLSRKLFYENKLILNGYVVASNNESDLDWVKPYFFNIRIKKGFINSKRYYFLDYAGNYEVFKNYCKVNGLNTNDEKYDIHVSDMIQDKEKFINTLRMKKLNYYIKYFDGDLS